MVAPLSALCCTCLHRIGRVPYVAVPVAALTGSSPIRDRLPVPWATQTALSSSEIARTRISPPICSDDGPGADWSRARTGDWRLDKSGADLKTTVSPLSGAAYGLSHFLVCPNLNSNRARHLGRIAPHVTLCHLLGDGSGWVQIGALFSYIIDIKFYLICSPR